MTCSVKRTFSALFAASMLFGAGAFTAAAAAADSSGTEVVAPPADPGPPGYAMTAPTGARIDHAEAAPPPSGAPVNASFSPTPPPSPQPDLPPGSGPTMR